MRTPLVCLLSCWLTGCAACGTPPGPGDAGPDSGVADGGGGTDGGGGADGGNTCALNPDCRSTVVFSTRLDVEPNRLNALRMTVCHQGTCATARPRLTSGVAADDLGAECVGAGGLSCVLSRRADGRFTATLALALAAGTAPVDGNVVGLSVVDSTSDAGLLQVTRPVAWEAASPATACGCRVAAQFVTAASAGNALCTTRPCNAGARLSGNVALQGTEPRARLCRGDACAIATVVWDDTQAAGRVDFQAPFAGASAVLALQGTKYHWDLEVPAVPDELAASDCYRFDVGAVSAVDQMVAYSETFPNTQACDTLACRSATVTVP